MARTHNFSAGPAALPTEVLAQAAEEMLDFQGSGMSVMEMSHRSKIFVDIAATAEQDLRDLFWFLMTTMYFFCRVVPRVSSLVFL